MEKTCVEQKKQYDILIIGAGVAGLSAAKSAYELGCRSILVVEHTSHLGGILHQCAHYGFGDGLNGPEYIQTLLDAFPNELEYRLNTTVIGIHADKTAVLSSAEYGVQTICFSQLILAAGCREIPAGALDIAGTRPMGVYTAGQMQEMINVYGILPQSSVVILGSGDIGLIMAKQIAEIGGEVALVEQNSVLGGLERNQWGIEQYAIPVYFDTTITELHGEKHLSAVTLGNGAEIPCKTLLIAAGLVPNQELLDGIGQPDWLHLCGNCNRIHAMIESVVYEGKKAGISACEKLGGAVYDR